MIDYKQTDQFLRRSAWGLQTAIEIIKSNTKENKDMKIKDELEKGNIRIDTFDNYNDPVMMFITYIPIGLRVAGSGRSKQILKKQLLKELEEKINA